MISMEHHLDNLFKPYKGASAAGAAYIIICFSSF